MLYDSWEMASSFYVLGLMRSDEFPKVAEAMMGRGCDSPSLHVLSSEVLPSDVPNVVTYPELFEKCIAEQGMSMPSREEALHRVMARIAEDMVVGNVSPEKGTKMLADICYELDYEPSLRSFYDLYHGEYTVHWSEGGGNEVLKGIDGAALEMARKLLSSKDLITPP